MACLILHSEAKVSHRNSTEVQTVIVMRTGKWETQGREKGEAKDFNGKPMRIK